MLVRIPAPGWVILVRKPAHRWVILVRISPPRVGHAGENTWVMLVGNDIVTSLVPTGRASDP